MILPYLCFVLVPCSTGSSPHHCCSPVCTLLPIRHENRFPASLLSLHYFGTQHPDQSEAIGLRLQRELPKLWHHVAFHFWPQDRCDTPKMQ